MTTLRATIENLCWSRLGYVPDINNPKGYNAKIQWLKMYDQRREHITACDKWAVREWIPPEHLVPAELGIAPGLFPGVVKCTHDSGSAMMVDVGDCISAVQARLSGRLSRPYGQDKGEWAYSHVPRQLMTEERLQDEITDYKFHCAHGRICWAQIISERSKGKPKETIMDAEGRVLPLHMDHKMRHAPEASAYPGARAWAALTDLAQTLADGWRYVRVDLYWSRGQVWFGELTFWPLSGCYLTKDDPVFGEMLTIDLRHKLEPLAA